MGKNVGTIDRMLRATFGAVLIWTAFAIGVTAMDGAFRKYSAAGVGVVMAAVAIIGVCPVYSILGVRTCRTT